MLPRLVQVSPPNPQRLLSDLATSWDPSLYVQLKATFEGLGYTEYVCLNRRNNQTARHPEHLVKLYEIILYCSIVYYSILGYIMLFLLLYTRTPKPLNPKP